LRNKAKIIWFIGLSGSGKSTLAKFLLEKFTTKKLNCIHLDGDNIRTNISKDLGFSIIDRIENTRRISELAKKKIEQNKIVIVSTISPVEEQRKLAKSILGHSLVYIYLNTPLSICEKRDTKGLYKKARKGDIKDFTGIDSVFETPKDCLITIDTSKKSKEECERLLEKLFI